MMLGGVSSAFSFMKIHKEKYCAKSHHAVVTSGRFRRIFLLADHPSESRFAKPTTAVPPWYSANVRVARSPVLTAVTVNMPAAMASSAQVRVSTRCVLTLAV